MALGVCACCSYVGDVERHHVGGAANFPRLTVDVCVSCHGELSKRQDAHGVGRERDVARSDVDRHRGLVVDLGEVHRLHLQHHPQEGLPSEIVLLLARVLSRALDSCEPADRPGRWLPDPTIGIDDVPPSEQRPGGDVDMFCLLVQLSVDVVDSLEHSPAHDKPDVVALRAIAADPLGFLARAEQELAASGDGAQMLTRMTECNKVIDAQLRFMLEHDPESWPVEMLEEPSECGEIMRSLLARVIDLAGVVGPVER